MKKIFQHLRSCSFASLFLACAALSTSCSSQSVEVAEILNHSLCQSLRKGLNVVHFEDLAKIRGVEMLTPPEMPQNVLLLAVSNGSQPTPGYRFELVEASARQQQLHLNYRWIKPSEDAVMSHMVTSPCSVIQINTQAELAAVEAYLDSETLGRVELTGKS